MKRISLKRLEVIFRLALVFSLSYVITIMIYHSIVQSSGIHCKTNTADSIHVKNGKFLFVAVLTTQKFLETRARAIYNTWGHRVPGKILFFVGANVSYTGSLPVHELSDIKDKTHPPQKKSFAMLSYVATHYIGEYEWFMRVDDDVFVKTDSLESFLRSFNNSELLYMGQAGTGAAEEKGKLGLVYNTPYCMGGPGVVFSPITLRILAQFLPRCLNSTYTLHEDTEIGRCVQRNLGIACTNANDALFHHNYDWKSGKFDLKLGSTEDRALTLHPLKKQLYMYHVENYFNAERLKHLRRKVQTLRLTEKRFQSIIDARLKGRNVPIESKSSEIRKRLRELEGWSKLERNDLNNEECRGEIWDFIANKKYIYSTLNMYGHVVSELWLKGRKVTLDKAFDVVQKDSRYHGKKTASFLYERLSFGKSMENIVPVYPSPKSSILVRTVQTFEDIQFIENDLSWKNSISVENPPKISMIVPLYKRSRQFEVFLSSLIRAMEKYHGKIDLYVMLYVDKENEFEHSKKCSKSMNTITDKLTIKLSVLNESFSRGIGLNKGAGFSANDSLLLIMDVDMLFIDEKIFYRVILNTVRGKQVYFPICFSQYNPNITCYERKQCKIVATNLDDEYGTWRFYGFGIVSIYKEDFVKSKGYRKHIKGWGKEDVEFLNDCLQTNLHIFRSVEPYLVHFYHHRDCDSSLPKTQFEMCLSSRYHMYGHPIRPILLASSTELLSLLGRY